MYKYMIRQPIYRYFIVGRYIACFLCAALLCVVSGYRVSSNLYRGLRPGASNDLLILSPRN